MADMSSSRAWAMMMQMGYETGKGLGVRAQGIVDPIAAVQHDGRRGLTANGKPSSAPPLSLTRVCSVLCAYCGEKDEAGSQCFCCCEHCDEPAGMNGCACYGACGCHCGSCFAEATALDDKNNCLDCALLLAPHYPQTIVTKTISKLCAVTHMIALTICFV
jgi:hypothetical protein